MLRGFPHQLARIGIGKDQAGIAGKNLGRKIRRDGKQQRITIVSIFVPFPVGTEIGNARFDFNDPHCSVARQG